MVLADSGRITRVPPYLGTPQEDYGTFRLRGYHPLWPAFPGLFDYIPGGSLDRLFRLAPMAPHNPSESFLSPVWALPLSLATTQGVEVSFLSSGYLDVSVPQLASSHPMYSGTSTTALPVVGFPIRKSRGQRLVSTSPELIAAAHVLLRLLAPRHPPCALSLLIVKNSLVTAMEFSRCARTSPPNQKYRCIALNGTRAHRSLKTQQRSSRSTLF